EVAGNVVGGVQPAQRSGRQLAWTYAATDGNVTVLVAVVSTGSGKPAAATRARNSSASARACSERLTWEAPGPTQRSSAAAIACVAGLCAIGPNTFSPTRPPLRSTRRISPSAAGRSEKNWRPSWQATTSNEASASGNATAFPLIHATEPSPAATASISALR